MVNKQDEKSVDEDNANVAAFFPSYPTCTLGLMIKLKFINLIGIEKIIPDLDIKKKFMQILVLLILHQES